MKGDLVDIVLTAFMWLLAVAMLGVIAFAFGLVLGWFG